MMRLIFFGLAVLTILVIAVPIVIAVWLAIIGVIISALSFAMPWVLFGLVIWAFLALGRRPERRRLAHYGWQPQPTPGWRGSRSSRPRVQTETRPQPPSTPKMEPRPELPIAVQVKVEQIRRKVEVLLGYASRFPPFSKELYLVRQTANEYLPRTIDAYLALPPGDADRILTPNGKTALQELTEQLDLLDAKLSEIAENLQRRDLDRLLANRRFLEERFGRTNL
jgi:hypothetical protein